MTSKREFTSPTDRGIGQDRALARSVRGRTSGRHASGHVVLTTPEGRLIGVLVTQDVQQALGQ